MVRNSTGIGCDVPKGYQENIPYTITPLARVNWSLSFLFLAVVFCCCSVSALRFAFKDPLLHTFVAMSVYLTAQSSLLILL